MIPDGVLSSDKHLSKSSKRQAVQKPLGQSRQHKMLKPCSTPQLGRMALPGAFSKKYPGRPKANPWPFGVADTKPNVLQLKKRYWQRTKELELPQKRLVLKHSSS